MERAALEVQTAPMDQPLGDSIFLRAGSSVTFLAQDTNDLLTLGEGVGFTDDTVFGAGGTSVLVTGNGTVVYNGTTGYQGVVKVNNANFKVNGEIDAASIFVCRNLSFSRAKRNVERDWNLDRRCLCQFWNDLSRYRSNAHSWQFGI